jgi:hypothetical protein
LPSSRFNDGARNLPPVNLQVIARLINVSERNSLPIIVQDLDFVSHALAWTICLTPVQNKEPLQVGCRCHSRTRIMEKRTSPACSKSVGAGADLRGRGAVGQEGVVSFIEAKLTSQFVSFHVFDELFKRWSDLMTGEKAGQVRFSMGCGESEEEKGRSELAA